MRACARAGSPEALERYREARGLEGGDGRVSVLVQELVRSEVAGVAFTMDPLSGDRERIVVDATYGLGSAVVSGSVVPDHFVLDRQGLERVSVRLAHKDRSVRAVKKGQGTEIMPVPQTKAHAPSLAAEELEELCRLALEAESTLGAPQDVEWARHRKRFFLLQSRPVTARRVREEVRSAEEPAAAGRSALIEDLLPLRLSAFEGSFLREVLDTSVQEIGRARGRAFPPAAASVRMDPPTISAELLEALGREAPPPLDALLDPRMRSAVPGRAPGRGSTRSAGAAPGPGPAPTSGSRWSPSSGGRAWRSSRGSTPARRSRTFGDSRPSWAGWPRVA